MLFTGPSFALHFLLLSFHPSPYSFLFTTSHPHIREGYPLPVNAVPSFPLRTPFRPLGSFGSEFRTERISAAESKRQATVHDGIFESQETSENHNSRGVVESEVEGVRGLETSTPVSNLRETDVSSIGSPSKENPSRMERRKRETWRPCDGVADRCRRGLGGEEEGGDLEGEDDEDDPWLTITVLLPNDTKYEPSLSHVIPWIKLAIEDSRKQGILPAGGGIGTGNGVRGKGVKLIQRDSKCSATHGSVGAVDAYAKDCANLLIGPSCEFALAAVARLIKFWNIPLLTAGGFTFDFAKPKTDPEAEYYLLVRLGRGFREMTFFFMSTMDRFGWRKVLLVYEVNGYESVSGPQTCKMMMSSMVEFLKNSNKSYSSYNMEQNAKDGIAANLRREVGYTYGDLFLGPVCEYALAPVARYASAWRIPVITAGGRADAFRHKAPSYATLTRIAGPYSGVGAAMRVVLAVRFGWKRAAMLYHNNARDAAVPSAAAAGNSRCHFALGAVFEAMGRVGPHMSFDEARVKEEELRRLLLAVAKSARIIVICANPHMVREILLAADELNMVGSGEYVFFNIELFSSLRPNDRPWYNASDSEERNTRAKRAYEALMTVTARTPSDPEYLRFSKEVNRMARERWTKDAVGRLVEVGAGGRNYYNITTDEEVKSSVGLTTEEGDGVHAIAKGSSPLSTEQAAGEDVTGGVANEGGAESGEAGEEGKKGGEEMDDELPVSTFVTAFYDAVILYAMALNETLLEGGTVRDGEKITRRMWNRTFTGITGEVTIDTNGDRIADYSLLDMDPNTYTFKEVAHYDGATGTLIDVPGAKIHWAGGRTTHPPDTPQCGFDNSLCPDNSLPGYAILSIVLSSFGLALAVASIFIYRHYKLEAEIASMTWRVMWPDILVVPQGRSGARGSVYSLAKRGSQATIFSEDAISQFNGNRQVFIPTAIYKGCNVAIKNIKKSRIELTRPVLLELKKMKDLHHDHLVRFIGACVDPPHCCLLTEYCPRGALQDVLENEKITLDWTFRYSLMHDIVKGMCYLHASEIRTHGNLKSSNCVVDSRFVLKITDFGLQSLRGVRLKNVRQMMDGLLQNDDYEGSDSDTYAFWRSLLWTAPELLRSPSPPPEGTQKGDVYSFAIIVHEILTRQGPFYLSRPDLQYLTPQDIVMRVCGNNKDKEAGQEPFRPSVEDGLMGACEEEVATLMRRCWAEDPPDRPDFQALKSAIRKLNKDYESGNILDNLLSRMEQYANNLEALVEERTADYLEEKRKCEELLYQLLPKSVANQLIQGQSVIAETYDSVTIYFSDIVGFTSLSAESTPMQVVDLLNDLYTYFDSIIENFDVYKVETIGDAYMVVSGLPVSNGDCHAREIARMANALLNAVLTFKIRHRPDEQLKLRIGLHTGPCVAGVVGLKMPRYCLFGDTVNTASRMESNGLPLKIHVSSKTKEVLDTFGTFELELRGDVEMKGKGKMRTYWLIGEKGVDDNQQPALSPPPHPSQNGAQGNFTSESVVPAQNQQRYPNHQRHHQEYGSLAGLQRIQKEEREILSSTETGSSSNSCSALGNKRSENHNSVIRRASGGASPSGHQGSAVLTQSSHHYHPTPHQPAATTPPNSFHASCKSAGLYPTSSSNSSLQKRRASPPSASIIQGTSPSNAIQRQGDTVMDIMLEGLNSSSGVEGFGCDGRVSNRTPDGAQEKRAVIARDSSTVTTPLLSKESTNI